MRDHLSPLTSLRFLAALAIVFHHLAGVLWLAPGALAPYSLGAAVSFFFVLSGFIMHHSYAQRLSVVGWRAFLLQRFLRIWPAHIAVIVLCALWISIPDILWQTEHQSTSEILQILFLFQAWNTTPVVFWGLNGPSWSLSVELFFYGSFPFLLVAMRYLGQARFLLGAAVFTIAWLTFATLVLFDPDAELNALALGYISPAARLGEFALGMAVGALFVAQRSTWQAWSRGFWTLAECLSVIACVLSVRYTYLIGFHVGETLGPVAGAWASASFGMLSFAVVVGVFAVGKGALSRVLELGLLVWLGHISFAMYLVHQPLIGHWVRVVEPVQTSVWLEVLGFAIALILLSAAVFYWIERPGMTLARQLSRHLRPPPAENITVPTDAVAKTEATR
ncbi:MAG: acyltransferase [Rhodobacteraceae bacterium]|nr:acyltransferase [Paracoccaceae bacterium]